MEQMKLVCARHDDIPDSGDRIRCDVIGDAVLHDLVPVMGVKAIEEDHLCLSDGFLYSGILHRVPVFICTVVHGSIREDVADVDSADDLKVCLYTALSDKAVQVLLLIVDQDRLLSRIVAEIPLMAAICPERDDQDLHRKHQEQIQDIGQPEDQQPDHDVCQKVRQDRGEGLRIDDLRDGAEVNEIPVIQMSDEIVQDHIQPDHQIVSHAVIGNSHLMRVVQVPSEDERNGNANDIEEFDKTEYNTVLRCISSIDIFLRRARIVISILRLRHLDLLPVACFPLPRIPLWLSLTGAAPRSHQGSLLHVQTRHVLIRAFEWIVLSGSGHKKRRGARCVPPACV